MMQNLQITQIILKLQLYRDSTVMIYSKKLKFTVIKPCLMHDNSKVKILIYISN